MAMEHRYSQRTRASAKLLIYKKGVPVAIGKAQNISRHGLFVATDYGDIGLHQPLEVEFLGSELQNLGAGRFKTFVVHKAPAGFGVAIEDETTTLSQSA
jgi:hypothetical protein